MSKPVKELMRKDLARRFADIDSMAICGFSGLNAEDTGRMRGRLEEKEIRFTVVKNAVARQAFQEVGLDKAADLLEGPCAIAWGSDSVVTVVRELLEFGKESDGITVRAALMEGDVFSGTDEVQALSKFPTRDEAIGQVLACALSGGANIASVLIGPSGQVAGILKSIEEKDN